MIRKLGRLLFGGGGILMAYVALIVPAELCLWWCCAYFLRPGTGNYGILANVFMALTALLTVAYLCGIVFDLEFILWISLAAAVVLLQVGALICYNVKCRREEKAKRTAEKRYYII